MSVHELPAPRFLTFEVSGRPRGKGRHRTGKGRTYTPKETKQFQNDVGWMARAALSLNQNRGWPVNGKYQLRVHYRMADNRWVPDEDNVLKVVQDALQGILYTNDKQVKDGRGIRDEPNGVPCTLVTIRVLDDAALPAPAVRSPTDEAKTQAALVVARCRKCQREGGWGESELQEFWRELLARVELFVD